MKLLMQGNTFDAPIPVYYIEDETELTDIPANAPAGTIVECNASTGFKLFMRNEAGEFNEL